MRPTSSMTASARKAVREIVATMPITRTSAQALKKMRRAVSRTRTHQGERERQAERERDAEGDRVLRRGLGAQRAVAHLGRALARVLQEREDGAQVVEDVVLRARLDDRAERHDGAADDDRLDAALDVGARAHARGDEHEHDRERQQVGGRLRGLGAQQPLGERRVVHGQRDHGRGAEDDERAAEAAGADACASRRSRRAAARPPAGAPSGGRARA